MNASIQAKQSSSTDTHDAAILAEQISQIYAALNNAIIATFISSFMLVFVLWSVIDHDILLTWLAAIVIISLARSINAYQYYKTAPHLKKAHLWSRRFLIGSLLASLVWGASSIWLFPVNDLARQVFLAFIIGGMAAGAVTSLSYMKLPIYFYLCLTLTPLLIRFFYSETELGIAMASMIALHLVMMVIAANRTHSNIKKNICLHIESVEQEQALLQSERRYKNLLDTATDAFFLHDLQGKFLDVNQQACHNLGYTRDELLNMSVSEIEIGADLEMVKQLWPKLQKGNNIQLEGEHRRKDGTTFPVDVRLGLVQMGNEELISVLARDVSERKQAEHVLENYSNLLAMATRAAGIGIWDYHLDTETLEWDDHMFHIYGITADQFPGAYEAWSNAVHPNDLARAEAELNAAITGLKDFDTEFRIVLPDGQMRYIQAVGKVDFNEAGDAERITGINLDITKRKLYEHELIAAKEYAEESNCAKSQFLSRMSHELRTPLNAVLGFAQILDINENKSLGPEEKKSIKQILKGGWHLLDVVNDLLDLAAIEANKIEFQMEAVDLLERLQDSLDVMQPLAQQCEISFQSTGEACAEIFVQADPVRLKQVLLNLLSNAVKYNHKGGSVTLSCELVDTATVRISVTDTGSGIPAADIPTLFEPFNRLYLTTHALEGTGIGLTIAKQLVELMEGRIGVTSELGHGSTFWIELPLSQSPAQAIPATITPSVASSEAVVAETTLLYIEDSPSHIHLVEAITESMTGIRLLSAHTPMLGLELAQAHRPNLIVCDVCLPGMDGFEVMERLGASDGTREIPVIAVSANAMPLDIEKGLRAGFRRYLTKPINVTEFKKALDELLRDSATLPKSDS